MARHPLKYRSNGLDPVKFGSTSGWSIAFTLDGLPKMCASPLFQAVCPYFKRIRLPHANAWIMNILVSQAGTAGDEEDDAAGAHKDNTLALLLKDNPWPAYAHEVDVLYLQVPPDRVGGDLEIWPLGVNASGARAAAAARAVIHVEENKLVRFMGDAEHRVRRHLSASGGERVSLVTEQYIIPEPWHSRLPGFYMLGQATNYAELIPYVNAGHLPLDLSFRELRQRSGRPSTRRAQIT